MADLYSIKHRDRDRRVEDLLRLFELQDKGSELIQGYSRGMRQKIALAGALIHAPKVILLDEPTVGLDPKGARTMKDILRELCDRGTTVFISTHILEIAERMCDRVAIVNRGKIIAQGTLDELRAARTADRPASAPDTLNSLTGERTCRPQKKPGRYFSGTHRRPDTNRFFAVFRLKATVHPPRRGVL